MKNTYLFYAVKGENGLAQSATGGTWGGGRVGKRLGKLRGGKKGKGLRQTPCKDRRREGFSKKSKVWVRPFPNAKGNKERRERKKGGGAKLSEKD